MLEVIFACRMLRHSHALKNAKLVQKREDRCFLAFIDGPLNNPSCRIVSVVFNFAVASGAEMGDPEPIGTVNGSRMLRLSRVRFQEPSPRPELQCQQFCLGQFPQHIVMTTANGRTLLAHVGCWIVNDYQPLAACYK